MSVLTLAGRLEAIGLDAHGNTVASDVVQQTGAAAGIQLSVDYNADGLLADGQDVFLAKVGIVPGLPHVMLIESRQAPHFEPGVTHVVAPSRCKVGIFDAHGRLAWPGSDHLIHFNVTGGTIVGVCNGDPTNKRAPFPYYPTHSS